MDEQISQEVKDKAGAEANQILEGKKPSHKEEWEDFKKKFNKLYKTVEEEKDRLTIYLLNRQKIMEHNEKYEKGEVTFKMGINQFADLLPEEKQMFNGLRPRS